MTETRTTWGFVAYFLDLGSLASGGLTALMVTGLVLLAAGIVRAAAWHTLRADFSSSEFIVTFDGQRLFAVRDDTFAEAGKVGAWSKADSVTEFEHPQHGEKS